ncbi:nicotinamide/nicotinic acid mononucleotide adenylyltransferase 1-like isoform X1 [Branchiostoma floridae x Branchiostoma belcheri]
MAAPGRVVLLACGCFNPITNMHLRLFELARDHLERTGLFKVVEGIISPAHDKYGKKGLVPSTDRVAMAQLALSTSDWVRVDSWESEQKGWLETAVVARHLKRQVQNKYGSVVDAETDGPSRKRRKTRHNANNRDGSAGSSTQVASGDVQLKLLCGADLLESFAVPNLWSDEHIKELVSEYGLVVISRAGSNPEKFIYESDVLSKYKSNIHLVTEWIQNEISATKIRRSLKRKESVRYLVPDAVINYIKEHQLYQPDTETS